MTKFCNWKTIRLGVGSAVSAAIVFASGGAWALPLRQCEMTVGGYAGSSTLANFPLLVKISPSVIDGFAYADCATGGADISFALEDGTILPHEVDTWNPEGESLVWVKLPSLSGKTTKFKFRWSDPLPEVNDPTQVWSEYTGVWHLGEADPTALAKDATGHGFDATILGSATEACETKAAKVGNGRWKPKTSMTVPNYDSQNTGKKFTASGWFYMDERTTYESFFSRKQAWNEGTGWSSNMQNSDTQVFLTGSGATTGAKTFSKSVVKRWIYYVLAYNDTTLTPYDNGTALSAQTILAAGDNGRNLGVGSNIRGMIDEIRIRKAVSSADWVKAEYDHVTSASFVTAGPAEILSTTAITVGSTLLSYGTVQPDYGVIAEPTVGQEYVFTCTRTEQSLVEGQTKAVCTGWKLSRLSDGGLIKSSADAGEEPYVCRHTYAQGEGVNLEWQWVIRHKVVATAGAGGTVDKTEQWVDDGTDATITATAGEGSRFLNWNGDSTAFVTPLTLTAVTKPMTVAASFCPADWNVTYVSTTGEATGTGSASAPFNSVQKAIDAAGADGVVLLAAGTYSSASSLLLTNGVSLVGGAPTNTAVTLELTASSDSSKNVLRIQSSSKSVVTNLTLTNGNRQDGSGVVMNSGLITHCVIRDCRSDQNSVNGGGVNMSGGTVRRCLITNCDAYDTGGAGKFGGGIYMTGGTVEFCNILKNKQNAYGGYGRGGGVYMTGGTLRNCLVAGNKAVYEGSGVWANAGTIENCTIVGNTQKSSGSAATGLCATGVILRNNLIWGNTKYDGVTAADLSVWSLTAKNVYNNNSPTAISTGSNNIAVNPQFVDAAKGDYRLGYSDCVNGGSNQTWMATATDLDGNPRIVKKIVDIGCYERVASTGLECKFTVATAKTLDTATATVNAEVDGDDTGLVYYWTFTRIADNAVVRLVGDDYRESFTYDFPAGVWDARLDVTNATLSSAFAKTEKAMDIRASVAYVSKTGTPTYPYATLGNASTSVNDAFAVLGEGGVLYIDEGDYTITSQIALSGGKGAKVVSLKGPEKTSVRLANVAAFTSQGYRGLVLTKASAWLEGLTIAGGKTGPQYSGTAYGTYGLVEMTIADATMTNCVLRDAKAASYGQDYDGLGLKISGGNVCDCTFQNISAYGSGGAGVTGAAINGWGTFDRVVVTGCHMTGTSTGNINADVVYLTGGSMRNALITGCTALKSVPVGINGASFVNCTVVCNTNLAAASGYSGTTKYYNDLTAGVTVHSGTVKNCIIAGNRSTTANCVTNLRGSVTYTLVDDRASLAGEGNRVGDPKFYSKPDKKWHIKSTSPALNAGQLQGWMTETSVDLGHTPRVRNRAPDMGCYEGDASGLILLVK